MKRAPFLVTCALGGLACAHTDGARNAPQARQRTAQQVAPAASSVSGKTPILMSAKEECELLMNSAVPFARHMLAQHREFLPYGEGMAADGQIVAIAGDTGEEHPASQAVIDVLEKGFRESARAGKYKATALVIDMRVVPPGKDAKQDAIAVRLDHRDGYSVIVVFPYTIGAGGELTIEEPFAVKGEHSIFAQ
jgi:hypothetical protein